MRLEIIGWTLAASAITATFGNGADGDLSAKVDAIFAGYQRTDSAGCALGVFREGAIEYARGYGMANLELESPSPPPRSSSPSVELSFEGEALAFKRRGEAQRFSRIAPWKPAGLEEFRGLYRSEEIAGSIEVDLEEGSLVLRHRTIPDDPLKPTAATRSTSTD